MSFKFDFYHNLERYEAETLLRSFDFLQPNETRHKKILDMLMKTYYGYNIASKSCTLTSEVSIQFLPEDIETKETKNQP